VEQLRALRLRQREGAEEDADEHENEHEHEHMAASNAATGLPLPRALAQDRKDLQARVASRREMEAGGRAALFASASSHLTQRATASVYKAFPKWTPGLHDTVIAALRK
jgi:hypothetical protein